MFTIFQNICVNTILLMSLLFSSLFLIACTTIEPVQALGYTWREYERTIRWGDLYGTVHFLKEDAVPRARLPKNIQNLKVTGYEVINKSINEDEMIAHQTVKIRYYNVDDLVEFSFIDKQEWQYDMKNNRWYLASSLPSFKPRK